MAAKVLYVDVDGTLVGPGGELFVSGSTRVAEALVRARQAGVAVVPVTGRGRVQVFELCRLLGLPRGVAELGCVHVEGHDVRYALADFPFPGETPVEAMVGRGAIDAAVALGLEAHDPWNEGREATFLLRGAVDLPQANASLAEAGFGWCELFDNGPLRRPGQRVYHLGPARTGKAFGVHVDRSHHAVAREDAVYVGDSASDLGCATEVGELWLVANADPSLSWDRLTVAAYGDGVAEVVDRLLARVR